MGVCCCGVDVRPWRVRRDIGSRRMVYLPASRGGCPGLQENLCQLSRCYARRRYGACACGQAILANIWGQKSLNSVVECAPPDADDGTELDTAKNSVNIMAFLLQKIGVPAGA